MTTKEKYPWIRVSEQLPEDGELVLTRLEMHDFEPKLNVYNGYYKVWDTEDGEDLVCPIMDDDLWMRIPDLKGWIMEYDQTQIFIIRGLNDCSIHFSFTDDGLSVSVFTRNGLQGDFYFNEITLKVFAYAYKIHCEKIRELNEKERNS